MDSRTITCYFVGNAKRSRGFKFYNLSNRSFSDTGNTRFLEDVEVGGGDKVRDIVFEEEYISLPTVAIGGDQARLPDIVQEANPEIQDNIPQLPIPHEEVAPEEQPQQPQEEVPLRRSTRERRSALSDDYIIFLQEHEENIRLVEDDPSIKS